MRAWIESEGERVLTFPHAFSNSADTKVSVPSLFTGVSPERPIRDFHRSPFAWQWAAAAGLQPLYVTSQRYRWSGFHEFFKRGFPGPFISAEDLKAPLVNDIGVDDALSSRRIQDLLGTLPADQPFFAVYNPNALHGPFQQDSPLLNGLDLKGLGRQDRAHRILDEAIMNVLLELERTGRMERTFVFFTGDHGSGVDRNSRIADSNLPARLFNYRDAVIRVPWMLRVPEAWKKQNPSKLHQARANRSHPIGNIDFLPTLIDLLHEPGGRTPTDANAAARALLSGHSVLGPIPHQDRILHSLIPIRRKAGTRFGAFSLIHENWRLIYSSQNGFDLYDISTDPDQRLNLHGSAQAALPQEKLMATALRSRELREILRRGKSDHLTESQKRALQQPDPVTEPK